MLTCERATKLGREFVIQGQERLMNVSARMQTFLPETLKSLFPELNVLTRHDSSVHYRR